MIVYVDSSVLARAYLPDEAGHDEANRLLEDPAIAAVTGTWTHVEVSGALVRAARHRRVKAEPILAALDGDLGPEGAVTLVSAPQGEIEAGALRLVREHGLRAMDAWHLVTAQLTVPGLLERGEHAAFASRDTEQARVAEHLGFALV